MIFMREMPRIGQRPESPDNKVEKEIDTELEGLQTDTAELEQHIASEGTEPRNSRTWERIEAKYNNLTNKINGLSVVAGAIAAGTLLQDVLNPSNFTLYESIDWNDLAGRGARDAVIIAAVYAVARVGALLLKRHRESKLEKGASENSL